MFPMLDFVQFLGSSSERGFLQLNEFLRKGKNTHPSKFITLEFASLWNLRPKIVQSRAMSIYHLHDRKNLKKCKKKEIYEKIDRCSFDFS